MTTSAIFLNPSQGEIFTIIDGSVRMLADSAATGGQCTIFEAQIPPADGPPLHRHTREDELFFVLEGRFKFRLDEQSMIAEPGSFICAPRGSLHAFKNIGPGVGRLHITCTPGGIDEPFRAVRIPEPGSNRPPLSMDELVAIFSRHGITFHGPPLE